MRGGHVLEGFASNQATRVIVREQLRCLVSEPLCYLCDTFAHIRGVAGSMWAHYPSAWLLLPAYI